MDDSTVIACVVAVIGGASYITYVIVTHGDGAVFGAFCAFLGGLGVHAYHTRKNKKTVKKK